MIQSDADFESESETGKTKPLWNSDRSLLSPTSSSSDYRSSSYSNTCESSNENVYEELSSVASTSRRKNSICSTSSDSANSASNSICGSKKERSEKEENEEDMEIENSNSALLRTVKRLTKEVRFTPLF